MPPHKLILKGGIPVSLLRNLNPYQGLCNGTTLFVVNVYDGRVFEAVIRGGRFDGQVVPIPRIGCYPKDGDLPFAWLRRQFPVHLCFATINKNFRARHCSELASILLMMSLLMARYMVLLHVCRTQLTFCFALKHFHGLP